MPFSLKPVYSDNCEQAAILHYLTTSCATFKCASYLFTSEFSNCYIFDKSSYIFLQVGAPTATNLVLPSGLYYLVIHVYTIINCIVKFK